MLIRRLTSNNRRLSARERQFVGLRSNDQPVKVTNALTVRKRLSHVPSVVFQVVEISTFNLHLDLWHWKKLGKVKNQANLIG
jgi:hypothetical protein